MMELNFQDIRKKLPVILMAAAAPLILISAVRIAKFAKQKAWYTQKTTGTVVRFVGDSKVPVFEYKDEYGFDREYQFENLAGQYAYEDTETLYRNPEIGEMKTAGQLFRSLYAGIGWLCAAVLVGGAGFMLYQYDRGKLKFPTQFAHSEKEE